MPITDGDALGALKKFNDAQPEADGSISIPADDARLLLPAVRLYTARLAAHLGPIRDSADAVSRDHGIPNAKWGAGKGWQYYCCLDFISALETAIAEKQPVVFRGD